MSILTKTDVFFHSYCLYGGETGVPRLTTMSLEAGKFARKIATEKHAVLLMTAAYEWWETEINLQLKEASAEGFLGETCNLGRIKSTADEVDKVLRSAQERGIDKLIIVAEKWHAKRSYTIFNAEARRQNLKFSIEMATFKSSHYEKTLEPSLMKSVRTSKKYLWILWNLLFTYAPSCTHRMIGSIWSMSTNILCGVKK